MILMVVNLYFVFLFKQKTAYDLRISDWSSDVCSSDLVSDASRLDAELSRAETDTVELGELLHALVEVQEAGERVDGPCFRLDVLDHQDLAVPGIEGRLGPVFRNLISHAVTF